MNRLKELYHKYHEIILYVWFGGWTTVVNYVSYLLLADVVKIHYLAATVIAWLLSVIFAYLTNRKWVFSSQAKGAKAVCVEAASFFGSRLFSGACDFGLMYLAVDVLHLNGDISKIVINVLVIVLNYLLSKLFVFRKKKNQSGNP